METPNPGTRPSQPDPPPLPPPEQADPQHEPAAPASGSARWAPWWVYLIVLLGTNYLRAGLLPVGTVPEAVVVVIALVQAAVLFLVVTAVWRYFHRPRS